MWGRGNWGLRTFLNLYLWAKLPNKLWNEAVEYSKEERKLCFYDVPILLVCQREFMKIKEIIFWVDFVLQQCKKCDFNGKSGCLIMQEFYYSEREAFLESKNFENAFIFIKKYSFQSILF